MSSKLLSILLLLFVPFPMHGIVQYDYKAFFLPYNFGHLYTWTFTISKIVTQASLVEISDKTFAVNRHCTKMALAFWFCLAGNQKERASWSNICRIGGTRIRGG